MDQKVKKKINYYVCWLWISKLQFIELVPVLSCVGHKLVSLVCGVSSVCFGDTGRVR